MLFTNMAYHGGMHRKLLGIPSLTVALSGILVGAVFIVLLVYAGRSRQADNTKPNAYQATPAAEEQVISPPSFQFPAGDQQLLPHNRMVALYGTPGTHVLGSLGEQDLEAAIARVKALAAEYDTFSEEPVIPSFEIITTVASAGPTADSNYSNELDVSKIKPWVDAAKTHGIYVVLDLQPGRSDFLTQAKQYEALLKEPHVGLALDPEWRLGPNDVHMKKIGSVESSEINQTATWLADLTRDNSLPQKLLLLHQFKLSMLRNIAALDTARPELAYLIQMDGLGLQAVKQDTWRNITAQNIPAMHYGWKNFIDEDKPMLTPEQTMQVHPKPFYVSYQ